MSSGLDLQKALNISSAKLLDSCQELAIACNYSAQDSEVFALPPVSPEVGNFEAWHSDIGRLEISLLI